MVSRIVIRTTIAIFTIAVIALLTWMVKRVRIIPGKTIVHEVVGSRNEDIVIPTSGSQAVTSPSPPILDKKCLLKQP